MASTDGSTRSRNSLALLFSCLGLGLLGALFLLLSMSFVLQRLPTLAEGAATFIAGVLLGFPIWGLVRWMLGRKEETHRDQLNQIADILGLPPNYDDPFHQTDAIQLQQRLLLKYGGDTADLLAQCGLSFQRLERLRQYSRDEWAGGQSILSSLRQHQQQVATSFEELHQAMESGLAHNQSLCGTLQETQQDVKRSYQRGQTTLQSLNALGRGVGEVYSQTDSLLDAVEQTGTTLDSVGKAFDLIHETAGQGVTQNNHLQTEAEQGVQQLSGALEGMERIRKHTLQAEEALSRLQHQSQEVANITEVIRELVADTELLAFNAAIIAAKAGEEGQAFSVIAEEIKELADRTTGSAQDIHRILRDIGKETDEAREAVDATTHRIGLSQKQARGASQVLQAILSQTESLATTQSSILQLTDTQNQQSRSLLGEAGFNLQLVRAMARALQSQKEAMDQAEQGVSLLVSALNQIEDRLTRQTGIQDESRDHADLARKLLLDLRQLTNHPLPLDQLEGLVQHALERNQNSQTELDKIQRQMDRSEGTLDHFKQQFQPTNN